METPVIRLSEEAMYEARAEAIANKIEERDRMATTLGGFENGKIASAEMPPDAPQYYGRLHAIDAEIAALSIPQRQYEQKQYDEAMEAVRDIARAELRDRLAERAPIETLENLQAAARFERVEIGVRAEWVEDGSISNRLSNDDYLVAYKQGGASELAKWYWEQKREHGFGNTQKVEVKMPDIGDGESLWSRIKNVWQNEMVYTGAAEAHTFYAVQEEFERGSKDREDLATRYEKRVDELETAVGRSPQEVAAAIVVRTLHEAREQILEDAKSATVDASLLNVATHRHRGAGEGYNVVREVAVEIMPELAKELPAPIQVHEVRVREVAQQRERTEDRSLGISA